MKKSIRQEVWNKFDCKCAYCGNDLKYKNMQVDHLVPKACSHLHNRDIDNMDNLMPSCRRCNHYKRAELLKNFRVTMLTLHKRIAQNYINKVALDYKIIKLQPFNGKFYFELKLSEI